MSGSAPPADAAYDVLDAYFGDLITRYVRGDLSRSDAIAGIIGPVEADPAAARAAAESLGGPLWAVWDRVVHAATDGDDTARDRLVALLVGVRDRDAATRDGGLRWAELPLLGAVMREAWNWGSPPDGDRQTWVNLNAFAARLTAVGIDCSTYAVWTLRAALEEPGDPDQLAAAVAWFRHCGPVLRNACEASTVPGRPPTVRPGRLAVEGGVTGDGFTLARWRFWHRRWETLASSGGPHAETARNALVLMDDAGR
ncbi:DUF3632 domain-containing protein [Mangrovihabitans endophyticus]|nr:DUF3632 domain-containing protein [Mangrovihabitans endophyticus]